MTRRTMESFEDTISVMESVGGREYVLCPPACQIGPLSDLRFVRSVCQTEALNCLLSNSSMCRTEAGQYGVNGEVNPALREAFEDQLNREQVQNTRWISAFAPIMVRGRPIDIANTGWGVIVAEREQDAQGFIGFTIKRQEGDSE